MTATETPEQLFHRYQQSADPADLAAVFDATAPQLLLLAAHVSPDGGAAEDLLQETFLQVMQNAEQWDATRPLLPWLGGILRHRAQDLARRLRLRRSRVDLAELVVAADQVGPQDAAQGDELLQRVQAALQQLQSPFREALVLRIVHGLQPTEIAHALGRSPATVRGQLKRGLATLRGYLPASLASALALLLLPGRGIAATRAAVLAAAGAQATTTVVVASGSSIAVARAVGWITAMAGLVAILVLGYALLDVGPSITPPMAPATGSVVSTASDDSQAQAPLAGGDPASTTSSREVVVVTKAPQNPERTTLRGRCVRATDGVVLASGTATVSFGRGRFMTEDEEYRNWPDPIVVDVAGDGTFAVELQPQPVQRVFLTVTSPGHTESFEEWTSLQAGLDIDLGDIKLLPGCILRSRVVDAQGVAVPDVSISITRHSGGTAGTTFSMWRSIDLRSDANGQLDDEVVPTPGSYGFSVSQLPSAPSLYRVVTPKHVDVGQEATKAVQIVVAKASAEDLVIGRVLDQHGQPVAGLTVSYDEQFMDIGSATTEADGSFVLGGDLPKFARQLYLPVTEQRFRLLGPAVMVTAGDHEVQLRVQRLQGFAVPIEVVAARTGQPVERFGIAYEIDYWIPERRLLIPPDRFYRPVAAKLHAGGRTVLQNVLPGQHRLMVWPEDQEFATAYMVPFTVGEHGAEPVRVELHGYAPARLHLQDEHGHALSGVSVQLTHAMATTGGFGSLFSVEQFAAGVGGGWSTGVALQTLTTDQDGLAVFRAPIAENRLGLQLSGPMVQWQRRPIDEVGPDGIDWRVTLPALARVYGTVGPQRFLARVGPSSQDLLAHQMVRSEDSELTYSCAAVRLRGKDGERGGDGVLWPDGTFDIQAATPGDYELLVHDDVIGDVAIATVSELRAGEVREVNADASKFVPSKLRVAVKLDGAPWARGGLGLVRVSDQDIAHIGLDSDGRGEAIVAPSQYLPHLRWEDADGEHYLFAVERIELLQGVDASLPLAFSHRVLRIEFVNQDGSAASKQVLVAKAIDFPEASRCLRQRWHTDESGVLLLDPAPPGRWELRLAGNDAELVGIVAAESRERTELRLQLPNWSHGLHVAYTDALEMP